MNRRAGAIAVIALAAVACASGARVDERKADDKPRGDMDPISALNEVCELLTRDTLSPAAARDALGRSGAAWVRAGRVVAAAGDEEPNHVELVLPAPLPLEAFERAFGAGRESPRLHPHSPTEVLYYPAALEDRRYTCAVIARLGDHGVHTVAVRRDPRL